MNPVLFVYNWSPFAGDGVASGRVVLNPKFDDMENTILVTGGAGFIGSNFILQRMERDLASIINLDKLTYAGNLHNLEAVSNERRYEFVRGDIADRNLVRGLLERSRPLAIVHFAAESHVDRSIRGPDEFIRTNVDGTFALLE
ncbi:MAG: GDP-mannose 4,6-dehydratase, partial [Candidatus Sulfotelmatobacter sp.]